MTALNLDVALVVCWLAGVIRLTTPVLRVLATFEASARGLGAPPLSLPEERAANNGLEVVR